MPDVAYSLTRRKGRRVTVVQVNGITANPETGERTMDTTVTNVRLVVKEPTSYGRLIKAQCAQQDSGETTFIFWSRDVDFTRLDVEDYIICNMVKHQVVTSSLEDTTLIVTAKEVRGAVGKQVITVSASNSLNPTQTLDETIT